MAFRPSCAAATLALVLILSQGVAEESSNMNPACSTCALNHNLHDPEEDGHLKLLQMTAVPESAEGDLEQNTDAIKSAIQDVAILNNGTSAGDEANDIEKTDSSDASDILKVLNKAASEMSPEQAEHNHAVLTAAMVANLTGVHGEDVGCNGGHDRMCFQGDMEASSEKQLALFWSRAADDPVQAAGDPWTSALVKYCYAADIDPEIKELNELAVRQFKRAVPCLKFEDVGNSQKWSALSADSDKRCDTDGPSIFVQSKNNDGCWSFVGMLQPPIETGSKGTIHTQLLNLQADGCNALGIAIHEMGHALGMAHEQSRPDRDRWVTIHWDNVKKSEYVQFEVDAKGYTAESYDYLSIMHYGSTAFSINEKPTITTPKGGHDSTLGQRMGLSQYDANQLAAMYRGEAECTAASVDGRTGCYDSDPDMCAALSTCDTQKQTKSCCACGGGVRYRCWSGSECRVVNSLPKTDHSKCIEDVTKWYEGYACVVQNTCDYKVRVECPEGKTYHYNFNPKSGDELPPETDGRYWNSLCAGGCTYTRE